MDWKSTLAVARYRIIHGRVSRMATFVASKDIAETVSWKTRVLFIIGFWVEALGICLSPQHSITSILISLNLLPLPITPVVVHIHKPWVIGKWMGDSVCGMFMQMLSSLIQRTSNMLHISSSPLPPPSPTPYTLFYPTCISTQTYHVGEKGLMPPYAPTLLCRQADIITWMKHFDSVFISIFSHMASRFVSYLQIVSFLHTSFGKMFLKVIEASSELDLQPFLF